VTLDLLLSVATVGVMLATLWVIQGYSIPNL